MKIDFYYWGAQCPINYETVNLLNRFKNNFDITFHDIDKFAFLTCLYLSSRDYDYKALPLKALENHLKKDYAVSDELGVFPNGNLEWFLEQGYADEGILSVEPGYCTLHLVCKSLHKA